MIKQQDQINDLNGAVLLISYDDPALLKQKMMHDLEVPYPILLDPSKETYARWRLGRTNLFGAMLSPNLNVRYVQLLARGERFLGLAPDMFQLGGDFVVDPNGRIAFAHAMKNNGDRAQVASLIEAMDGAANTRRGDPEHQDGT